MLHRSQILALGTMTLIFISSSSIISNSWSLNQDVIEIVVIYPAIELEGDDLSIITSIDDALNQLELRFDDQVNFTRKKPITPLGGEKLIIQSSGSQFDLIIAIQGNQGQEIGGENADSAGGVYAIAIGIAGRDNPDQSFLLIDGIIFNPNSHSRSVFYLEHEGSFLAGAMAAMVSNNKILGFYGTEIEDNINRYRFGFYQGANFIGDMEGVQYEFLEAFSDSIDGYNATMQQLQQGADVVFAVAGISNFDVFDAIEDFNDSRSSNLDTNDNNNIYAIGSNTNQDFVKPGLILTSMVKRIELGLEAEISQFVKGNWESGEQFIGLKDGHVGITEMLFTQSELIVEEDDFNRQTREELLQFLEAAIINKHINVSEDSVKTEIGITGENPFEVTKSADFYVSNAIIIGSLVVSATIVASLTFFRARIMSLGRKSDKSKAIDYLDKAKQIAEEPDDKK